MSSPRGTFSLSRSSGSGSGFPSLSRQISAASSRSASAERIALRPYWPGRLVQHRLESGPVLVDVLRQSGQENSDSLL